MSDIDLTCKGCGAILECQDLEDSQLYTLDNSGLPFVISCPPGYACNQGNSLTLQCCNQQLSVTFPKGATAQVKQLLSNSLMQQCQVIRASCGGATSAMFYNSPQSCTVLCPDGTPFVYTIQAGAVAAPSLQQANKLAFAQACVLAKQNKVCPKASKPTLDAYWTLDESGTSNNRVDKIHSIALLPSGVLNIMTGAPALFNNGVSFPEAGVISSFDSGAAPGLKIQTSNGWSIFGWFKILEWPTFPSYSVEKKLRFQALTAHMDIQMVWDSSTQKVTFFFEDNTTADFTPADFTPAVGTWYFFHLFFDPVTAKCGYSMNNGAEVLSLGGAVFASTTSGELSLSQNWALPDTVRVALLVDEMGVKLSSKLTSVEVTYLYNGGAGRTWPLT
jgi:hypothetical protein